MTVEEDEKSLPEQQIEELTKNEDNKATKLSQELEKMSGATGSKDRPLGASNSQFLQNWCK